jgi:uncharacterized membrane protein
MRVGYSGVILAIIGLPMFLTGAATRLGGKGSQVRAAWLVLFVIGCVALAILTRTSRYARKIEQWQQFLETRPIPRFTIVRVIVVLGVVAGICYLFVELLDAVTLYDPQFLLLVVGLVLSLNTLENLWVAADRRRKQAQRNDRKSFA